MAVEKKELVNRIYQKVLTALVLVSCQMLAMADEPETLSERIWSEIQGKPTPRIMDRFEILEGFPLVVNAEDISPQATALMAVFAYTAGPEWKAVQHSAFEEAFKDGIKELDRYSEEEIILSINTFIRSQTWFRLSSHSRERTQAREKEWRTKLVRESCLFDIYLREAGDLLAALEMFQQDYFLEAVIERQDAVTWEALKEAIDKKIPVILRDGDMVKVAVGYYVADKQPYVLIYHPAEAEYGIRTGIDNVPEGDRHSTDPTVQASNKRRMQMELPFDLAVKNNAGMPPGLAFHPFASLDDSSTLFIYGWTADPDSLYSKFLEFFKESEKEKQR